MPRHQFLLVHLEIVFLQVHFLPLSERVFLSRRSTLASPYLTDAEEEELVSFLLGCAAIGYPRTRKDVLAIVQDIIDLKGIESTVTDGWWTEFTSHHDFIALQRAVPLPAAIDNTF